MKTIPLNKEFQFNGMPFNFAFVLGTTRGAAGASDFTTAGTSQSFNLMPLDLGDMILYPLAAAYVAKRFTDGAENATPTTLANLKLDVGHTDDADAFIVGTNGDLIQDAGYPISPLKVSAAGGGADRITAASKYLTATLTSTAGNISTITFGEVIIFANVARVSDNVNRLKGLF